MRRLTTLIVTVLLATPAFSRAAVANDEVTSAKLKEADNAASQDTNSGSGVKTNHIQNKAVTGAKMADGTITATQLAAGAVTDAKISGPISTSKLNVGTAAGTLAAGNHGHDATYQRKYANVVVVAKSGGDYVDPIQAVSSITTASAANPWLVKIMPGVYDLGMASLQMKAYVDLEGSGRDNAVLKSAAVNSDGQDCEVGTVTMANQSAIRDIQLVNMPNPGSGVGVPLAFRNANAQAERVTILAGSASSPGERVSGVCSKGAQAHAYLNDVYVETHSDNGKSDAAKVHDAGSLTITNSWLVAFSNVTTVDVINSDSVEAGSITVSNTVVEGHSTGWVFGVYADPHKATLVNTRIILDGQGGTNYAFHAGQEMTIFNSQVFSSGGAAYSSQDPTKVKIAGSLLPGDRSGLVGAKLVHNYDETFNPIPNQ